MIFRGIKKGIMELADAIVVNKADGDNLERAKVAQGEYERMTEFIRPATEGWKTHAYRCSALKKQDFLNFGQSSVNSRKQPKPPASLKTAARTRFFHGYTA